MAQTSAVFPQGGGGKLYFEMSVELVSQDQEANTSTVKWEAYAFQNAPTGAWCLYHDASAWISVDGTVFQGRWNGTGDFDFRGLGAWQRQPVASGTRVIPHNADGTATVSWWGSATDTSFPLGTAEVSGSMALPTIPRASDFTMNVTSVPCNGVSTVGVTITPSVAGALHDVYWGIDGQPWSERIERIGVTSSTVSPPIPKTWANWYTNSNSGPMWCLVVTYYNGKELGRKLKYLTMTIPQTVEFYPTIATTHQMLQHAGLAGVTDVIRGYTGWRFTIDSASGVYGSRVARLEIVGPEGTKQGALNYAGPLTLDVNPLTSAGTQTYYMRVYDSRGRVSQTPVDVPVKRYFPPRVLGVSVNRSLSNGSLSDDGTNARIEGTAAYTPFSGNEYWVYASYRAAGTTTWSSEVALAGGAIPAGSAAMSAFTGTLGSNTLTPDKAWEIKVKIVDRVRLYEIVLTLPKARYIQSVDTNAPSVAFGGPANASPEFRVYDSMPAYFDGALLHRGQDVRNLYGRGWTIKGPSSGVLLTTDIAPAASEMWTLEIYSNSYSANPPGFTMLQGHAHAANSAIIQTSGFTTLPPFNAEVFFLSDRLRFWIPYMGYAQTHHFTLRGPSLDNRNVVSVVDSSLPSGRSRSVSIPVKSMHGPSAWTPCSVASGVTTVAPVQVKRVGMVVFLRGQVHNNGAWPITKLIATVPAGFRPSGAIAVPMTTDVGTYSGSVHSDGTIHLFGNTNMNAWPVLGGSWPVD